MEPVTMSQSDDLSLDNASWRLYPSPVAPHYTPGTEVFFRPKSAKERGRRGIIAELHADGRVLVNFQDRGPKEVSRKRLVPVYSNSWSDSACTILITPETIHYRHLAASQVTLSDSVLEIGCSTGEASAILTRYAGYWIGFDTSHEMMEQCREQLSSSNCESLTFKMDALADPTGAEKLVQRSLMQSSSSSKLGGPSAVFIDIGGNRDFSSVIRMIVWVRECFSPRLIVIKSRELAANVLDSRRRVKNAAAMVLRDDGSIEQANEWFRHHQLRKLNEHEIIVHPLKAPMVASPLDESIAICRYHNYHVDGCRKRNDDCPYDHIHCHVCQTAGHIARDCRRGKGSHR